MKYALALLVQRAGCADVLFVKLNCNCTYAQLVQYGVHVWLRHDLSAAIWCCNAPILVRFVNIQTLRQCK